MFSIKFDKIERSYCGQQLVLVNGECFCTICSVAVSWSGMAQHCFAKKKGQKTGHQTRLEVRCPGACGVGGAFMWRVCCH